MRTSLLSLIAVASVVACDSADDVPAVRGMPTVDTLSTVIIVTNPKEGTWRSGEGWTVREEFRVGDAVQEDGLAFSGDLVSVTLGPGGDIGVLDFLASEVTLLAADGAFHKRIARGGSGPGELSSPSGMAWDVEGRLWVADGFSGRYSVFDEAGAFIETVPRPIRSLARRQHPLVFERSGTLIDEGSIAGGVRFFRVNPASEIVDTLASLAHPPNPAFHSGIILRPSQHAIRFVLRHYRPELRWSVAPDGTVWVARSDDLTLYNLDLATGDTLRVVRTAHRDAALTQEDEDAIRRGLAEVGIPRGQAQLSRPVVQSIHATRDGFVLVQIVEEVGKDGTAFDVFEADGTFLGTMRTAFGIPELSVPTFIGDTLVAVTRGPLDVPQIVRATIAR